MPQAIEAATFTPSKEEVKLLKCNIMANKGILQNSGDIWSIRQSRISIQLSQNLDLLNKNPSKIRGSYIAPRKMISAFTKKMDKDSSNERSQDDRNKSYHYSESLIIKICLGCIIFLIIIALFTIPQWNYVNDWEIENSTKLN